MATLEKSFHRFLINHKVLPTNALSNAYTFNTDGTNSMSVFLHFNEIQ